MDVTIVLRQSPDWSAGAQDPEAFTAMLRRAPGSIARMIELWNETFPLSFHAVRARLKELTMRNLAAVNGAALISLEQYLESPVSDRWLLFTDDDDWFAPNLAHALAVEPPCDILIWGSTLFAGQMGQRPIERYCYTNNYAVNDRLRERPIGADTPFVQHAVLARIVKRLNVRLDERRLSVTNKHPASTVSMENALSEEFSAVALRRSLRGFLRRASRASIPGELEWSRPYVEATVELFSALDTGSVRERP